MCSVLLLADCKNKPATSIPLVKTGTVSYPTSFSVLTNNEVLLDGGSAVTARGVCWSTKSNPILASKDSLTLDGTGAGVFQSKILNLKPGVTYYLKAYATNSEGTGYGNQATFASPAVIPTLTTTAPYANDDKVIFAGGNITSDGGSAIIARGVCWSKNSKPTIQHNLTKDGSGSGTFSSLINSFSKDSTYYLRAYATNSVGTAYGNTLKFSIGGLIVKDYDGNFYHVITIGVQVWMLENLKSTSFRDSTAIPLVEANSQWGSMGTPAYCWYNESQVDGNYIYGALYNWYAVSSGKLCPSGWHVPTDDEWTVLSDYLGGTAVAGGKLKEIAATHWKMPNAGATNETQFTALPGGSRSSSGLVENLGYYGNWWSASPVNSSTAYYRYMYSGTPELTRSFAGQKSGFSVRCIKN